MVGNGFALEPDEMALLEAAVAADERGEDVHDAARAAVGHLDRPVRRAMMARLHDAGYIDAAILRGSGRIESVQIRRVLPKGFDAVRRRRDTTSVSAAERGEIEVVVRLVREAIEDSGTPMTPDERALALATSETLEAQLRSPLPNRSILREGLRTLRAIAENLAASGLYTGLLVVVDKLLK